MLTAIKCTGPRLKLNNCENELPVQSVKPVEVIVAKLGGHREAILVVREVPPVLLVIAGDHHVRDVGRDRLDLPHPLVPTLAIVRMQIVGEVP